MLSKFAFSYNHNASNVPNFPHHLTTLRVSFFSLLILLFFVIVHRPQNPLANCKRRTRETDCQHGHDLSVSRRSFRSFARFGLTS
ncbi:hypothetical protein M3Y98_00169800 [Aphelenchoides besseyi]|nr:hypothetical protein M3Y98_00169800 [Aphelenchoides besseyi]